MPADLRDRLGCTEIVLALGTGSLTRAERLADALDERVRTVFDMTRRDEKRSAEALIERVCDRYLHQLLAEDRLSRRSSLEFGDVDAALSYHAEHLAEALERRDSVRADADELLTSECVRIESLAPDTLHGLLVELLRRRVRTVKRSRAEREAEENFDDIPPLDLGTPADSLQRASRGPTGKTLGDLVTAFVEDRKTGGAWARSTPRTIAERERELQMLVNALGSDTPAREIEPEDVAKARAKMSEGRNVNTVRKIVGTWISAFNFAERMRWIDYNPARHLRPKPLGRASEQRNAFDDAELVRLFGPELIRQSVGRGRPKRLWVPLLMLVAGSRVGEAAQLETFDVREVDGIACVEFTERAFGPDGETEKRPLKSENAERVVPLHSQMLELGFLRYVGEMREAGERRLFPMLKLLKDPGPGEGVIRWFTEFRRTVGVTGKGKVLYSFRHTFGTRLKLADVQEATIAELMRHANPNITTGPLRKAAGRDKALRCGREARRGGGAPGAVAGAGRS